ncbi:MAG: MarR family winged helix-turn-helix transcriptional regulator [Pseudomonadota bacterium]|nr:MarR family winged helix-turn-helix transcriptional regulator [Pseudomonadota bacterium]
MQRDDAEMNETDDVRLGVLSDSLGFMLRLAQLRAFDDYFKSFLDLGHSPGTVSVLAIIAATPGIRQGVLARRLRIKPANMTKTVRVLEAENLVERHVPEDDRRALELHLSAHGRAVVEQFNTRSLCHEMNSYAPLEPGERQELMRLLNKYVGLENGERS